MEDSQYDSSCKWPEPPETVLRKLGVGLKLDQGTTKKNPVSEEGGKLSRRTLRILEESEQNNAERTDRMNDTEEEF